MPNLTLEQALAEFPEECKMLFALWCDKPDMATLGGRNTAKYYLHTAALRWLAGKRIASSYSDGWHPADYLRTLLEEVREQLKHHADRGKTFDTPTAVATTSLGKQLMEFIENKQLVNATYDEEGYAFWEWEDPDDAEAKINEWLENMIDARANVDDHVGTPCDGCGTPFGCSVHYVITETGRILCESCFQRSLP